MWNVWPILPATQFSLTNLVPIVWLVMSITVKLVTLKTSVPAAMTSMELPPDPIVQEPPVTHAPTSTAKIVTLLTPVENVKLDTTSSTEDANEFDLNTMPNL